MREPPSITVTGSATVSALPDTAEVTAGVVTQATTAAQANPRVAVTAATGDVVAGEYIVTTRPGMARTLSARAGGVVLHVY